MRDLVSLPKVDLHVHLEGSMRPSTLRELAGRHGAELPPGLTDDGYRWKSFDDFIVQYILVCRTLCEPEDFRRLAVEVCEDQAAQGTRYFEATFSALSHAQRLDGDWDTPVSAVLDGFEEGRDRFGVAGRLCLDHVRGYPVQDAQQSVDTALRYRDRGVVSLGLGGHEAFPPEPYEAAFVRAVDGGLYSVPHAGESEGPASIRGALRELRAHRIGHGFRALEDPDLVAELVERRIPLEVCPTSNVATGLVGAIHQHPLPALLDAGLCVTLNSDDPAMFDSPLAGEYEAARTVFGLDDDALADLARAGVRASFADEATKVRMLDEIDVWLASEPPDVKGR